MLGLSNRLRTMVSGINIAKRLNVPCRILWERNNDCNCNFSDLYDDPCLCDVSIEENPSILQSVGGVRRQSLPALAQKMGYDSCIYNFKWCRGKADIFKIINPKCKKLLLASYNEMYTLDGIKWGEYLLPREKLRNRIHETINRFTSHTVGIHIRGTDNGLSKKYSPLEAFVGCMTKVLANDSDAMFYLATDEEEYKQTLTEIFGTRVITNSIELTRHSLSGMEGALVDLYCLSRTRYIIGSFYSSFSEVAAEIGGIKLYVAMSDIQRKSKVCTLI